MIQHPSVPRRRRYDCVAWAVGVGVVATGIGLVAGRDPRFALVASFAVIVAAVMAADLTVGLCVFVLATYLETGAAAGGVSVQRVVGLLLLASWIAALVARRYPLSSLATAHRGFVLLVGAWIAWMAITIVWAEDPAGGLTDFQRLTMNLTLFPIVFSAVRLRRHAVAVLAVVVAGAASAATLGVARGIRLDDGRLAGAGFNPNQLGSVLVVGAIVGAALAAGRSHAPLLRFAAGSAALVCATAALATVSRGALLGAALAAPAAVALAGRGRRLRVAFVALLVAAASAGYIAAVATPQMRERLTASGDGSGRVDLWRVGWRMIEDQPLTGVGIGSFDDRLNDYVVEPGLIRRSDRVLDRPTVAHNIYLQIWAEQGVVGLGLFLGLLAFALIRSLRAAFEWSAQGDEAMGVLARATFVALVSALVAAFFASWLFSSVLWVMLAVAVALPAAAAGVDPERRASRSAIPGRRPVLADVDVPDMHQGGAPEAAERPEPVMPGRREGETARRNDVAIYMPRSRDLYERQTVQIGGAERQMAVLARALGRRSFRVAHVVFEPDDPVIPDPNIELVVRAPRPGGRGLRSKIVESSRVWRALARCDSEVYVVRGSSPVLVVAGLFCRLRRRHLIFSAANDLDFTFERLAERRHRLTLYRLGMHLTTAIVVQTSRQAALAGSAFPSRRPPTVIPNFGFEVSDGEPGHFPEALLWIGRLVDYKRPMALVDLARALPSVPFRMVAVDDEGDAVVTEVRAAAAGLANLELLEPMSHHELMSLITRAAAVVNTSTHEGMPNVFTEAWAHGVPVASLGFDPDGVIARKALGIVADENWDRFVAGAARLWRDKAAREEAGRRGREHVAQAHSEDAVATSWSRVIRDISGRSGRSGASSIRDGGIMAGLATR